MAIGVIANDDKNKLHEVKSNKYYDSTFHISLEDTNESHAIIANRIKPNSIVLDIGCAQGLIGEAISDHCTMYGIELDKEAIEIARKTNSYVEIYNFDISDKTNREYNKFFNNNIKFDYIIFSDVLEHLLHPDEVLYQFSKKLNSGGKILVSLPNIAHYDVVNGLLNENFNYSGMGILDNTHLRFFTKYSFAEYIKSLNDDENYKDFKFDLEIIGRTIIKPHFYDQYPELSKIISNNEQLFALQNIFELTKKNLNEKEINLEHLLSERRINLTKMINDHIYSLRNEIVELNEKMMVSSNKNQELQEELNAVYNSRSWKLTKPMRKAISMLRKQKENPYYDNHKQSILYLVQSWLDIKDINNTHIGGTTLHTLELIKRLKGNYNIFVLTVMNSHYVLITFEGDQQVIHDLNVEVKVYRYDGFDYEFLKMIYEVIDMLKIDLVHIQHIIHFPCDLQYIARKTKVILTLHDYTSICPNYFLIDTNHKYCQNANSENCLKCSKGIHLETRSNAVNNLIKSVDKVIVPDLSVCKEIRKYYDYDKFIIIPNGIDIDSFSEFAYCDKKVGKIKNVAFIGGLNVHKGSNLAKQIIKNKNKNIQYHLFGTSSDSFFLKDYDNYKYHGEYQKKDLPKLLNDYHIDLVLMLSICPESFSYVLSETAYAKIPVIALDIGAIGNRTKQMGIGIVLDYKSDYKKIIENMKSIFDEKNYKKYLKKLDQVKIDSTENMLNAIEKVYSNTIIFNTNKNYNMLNARLKRYKIMYKIKRTE